MVDPRPLRLEPGDVLSSVSPQGESVYFEVLEELGAGGSGVVYAAVSDDGQPAVIKGPRLVGSADPSLQLEAKLLRELPPHPALVSLLGVHHDPRGHDLIILERAFDNPLKRLSRDAVRDRLSAQRANRGGLYAQLPPVTALELGYELALALEHLHRHKVVHCDVKPENVLLRLAHPSGEIADHDYFEALAKGAWRAALIDLGGARTFKELREASAGVSGAQLPALTPVYAPPEVLPGVFDPNSGRERSRFSPWIDTYAFGLTLYQLLTGCAPYAHLAEPPDPGALASVAACKREERDGAHLPISRAVLDGVDWGDCSVHAGSDGALGTREALTERLWELLARSVYYEPSRRGTLKQMRADLASLLAVEPGRGEGPVGRTWVQRRLTLDAFSSRLALAGRDGTQAGKVDITKIRRGGADFWETQGFRPTRGGD